MAAEFHAEPPWPRRCSRPIRPPAVITRARTCSRSSQATSTSPGPFSATAASLRPGRAGSDSAIRRNDDWPRSTDEEARLVARHVNASFVGTLTTAAAFPAALAVSATTTAAAG